MQRAQAHAPPQPACSQLPSSAAATRSHRGCCLHLKRPPKPAGLLRSLAVLLLDPRGDVEAPRVGHEERASNVEAIHCASAKDVQQVALGDAVEADAEGKA